MAPWVEWDSFLSLSAAISSSANRTGHCGNLLSRTKLSISRLKPTVIENCVLLA